MGSTAGHWRFAPATCSLKRSSSLNGSKRINMACSFPFSVCYLPEGMYLKAR